MDTTQAVALVDEYVEREKKKCNLIVHNIPESTEQDSKERMLRDIRAFSDM